KRRKDLAAENVNYVEFVDNESDIDVLFLKQYIKEILNKMPEKSRLVFLYSREDGLRNPEIAKLMNISEKGVEANLTRAIKFLKTHMKRDGLALLVVYDVIKEYLPK
ncbi:MAG: RNA polymerase subunit sigma-70, partial [Sphingobacterium sp.]|nr:RNA polymerase subunit sigma-70 [Sphingobacterium sp.]